MLREDLVPPINFIWYRYRFLIRYVIFGFLSIACEVGVKYFLRSIGFMEWKALILACGVGISLAFLLNAILNFEVPKPKFRKAFILFSVISAFSLGLQHLISSLLNLGLSEVTARFVFSGFCFLIGYWLHRQITFKDRKKVGIAVYADGVEPIEEIYEKVGQFPDFIHVDIVDETFGQTDSAARVERMEVIAAFWKGKPIHCHIMSRNPQQWLQRAAKYSDVVFVHAECISDGGELDSVIEEIEKGGASPGLAVHEFDRLADFENWIPKFCDVLLLTIDKPGFSGQQFRPEALEFIEKLDQHPSRSRFSICVDGGVDEFVGPVLPVENVVSGSSVLTSENPKRQIMKIQTDSLHDRGQSK